MLISRVHIELCKENDHRLLAYCSLVFDGTFRVDNLRLINGSKGVFVGMPGRKLADRCVNLVEKEGSAEKVPCHWKNCLRTRFCGGCGIKLASDRIKRDKRGREITHEQISYPLTPFFRRYIEMKVREAYVQEKERLGLPEYHFKDILPEEDEDDELDVSSAIEHVASRYGE